MEEYSEQYFLEIQNINNGQAIEVTLILPIASTIMSIKYKKNHGADWF